MGNIEQVKESTKILKLPALCENIEQLVKDAESEELTYSEFLSRVLINEVQYRTNRAKARRIREAGFPYFKKLEDFDLTFQTSITERQLKQLGELTWIEQMYNVMFFGPPGVGYVNHIDM
jgi:DNA replication protein DnaC